MDATGSVECHNCGNEYTRLGGHWGHGCPEPTTSEHQMEILTGVFMGDGTITGSEGSRIFRLTNTNKTFLEWFDNQMGVMTTGLKVGRTPEQLARDQERSKGGCFNADNYKTTYYVQSRTLDWVAEFEEWYDDRKHIPENIELSPVIAKMWYVTDGTLITKEHERPYVRIADENEIKYNERSDFLISLFEQQGFEATTTSGCVKLYKDSSKDFFDWVGEPVPGFEYKWPN